MAHLARPFAGRFFAEVQREGGVQSVANEINIDVQQIYDLVNGKALSTKDLRVIYVWLSVRVTLLPHEIEDFQKLVKDAIPASDVQVQPSSRERGVIVEFPPRARARVAVAIQPGWLGVRELGSGAGGGRGEGLVPDLL